ncbi:MAG: NADP-dependent malic enzyme [Thiotrichales bacterium]
MSESLKQSALNYHRYPRPGKLEIRPTKPLANQRDLALAYSPGVAAACLEIEADPLTAAEYTTRANLVGVITNGTAVLGLGAIGALAGKPVMEGKAVLFKQFAGIDVFDIEIDERDPQAFIETVARLEPTFGGINLEDIKAPECFIIEEGLKARMKIPVFHDDQHGTAIVVAAAVLNALRVIGKDIATARLVTAGAGAAALACLNLLCTLGLRKENIIVTDIVGVVYQGRAEEMDRYKSVYAVATDLRTLAEALNGSDIFLGLSAAGVLKPEWLARMAERPLILALANPNPEIMPDAALAVRPDAIIATGRSDFPNQVNNVLCFPFLFRGALDVGATEINEAMKRAAAAAIAALAHAETSDIVASAYGGQELHFGPQYLIPKPFDPRLMEYVAPAVAQAAMESGVAQRPLADLESYRESLRNRVFRTGMTMKPVFDRARLARRRVIYAEGEEIKILQVTQQVLDQHVAAPILLGRRAVIEKKIMDLGLDMRPDRDFTIIEPLDNPHYQACLDVLQQRLERRGYSPREIATAVRTNATMLGATLLQLGIGDAMLCGVVGRYQAHLDVIAEIVGCAAGVNRLTSMNGVVLPAGALFLADTYVQVDPDAADLAEITRLCAAEVRWFGLEPKVALISHSNFGSHDGPSAAKMRAALQQVRTLLPELEIEGEMHANMALDASVRAERFPNSRLQGVANLLILPNQDAANVAFNLLRTLGEGIAIGPILVGAAKSAHVVTSTITVRGLLNMTALAAVRAPAPTP